MKELSLFKNIISNKYIRYHGSHLLVQEENQDIMTLLTNPHRVQVFDIANLSHIFRGQIIVPSTEKFPNPPYPLSFFELNKYTAFLVTEIEREQSYKIHTFKCKCGNNEVILMSTADLILSGDRVVKKYYIKHCTTEENFVHVKNFLDTCIVIYYKTMSILNAKNIIIQPNQYEDRFTKHTRKLYQNKNLNLKYHTLSVIKPGKTYIQNRKGCTNFEGSTPLHLCRGHLRTYTQERPLFGKLSGTFFIPAHVRGSIDNGAVVKDYRLKASP